MYFMKFLLELLFNSMLILFLRPFPNGTSQTFAWNNYTQPNFHLTLFTGKTYMFNITNVINATASTQLWTHGMVFTSNSTGNIPYNIKVNATTSPQVAYVNFTNPDIYEVSCAPTGACGTHHAQMNFYVDVVSSGGSGSGGTTTVTNYLPSNVTQTENVTAFETQNVTQTTTVNQTITQTQSLPGLTAIFTLVGLVCIIPIYRRRSRKN